MGFRLQLDGRSPWWLSLLALVGACGGEAFSAQEGTVGSSGSAGESLVGMGGSAGAAGTSSAGGASGTAGNTTTVEGGVVIDASTPPRDAATRFLDASALDATSPPHDSSTGGEGFCGLATHTFCCDFDEPNALTQWTTQILHSGGLVVINSGQATSASSSALVKSPASPDNTSSEATLQKTLDVGIKKQAHLAFDMQTSSMAPLGSSNAVTLTNGKMTIIITLFESNGQVTCTQGVFGDGYGSKSTNCPAPMTMGTWNHFDIVVTVNNLSVQVALTENGAPQSVVYQVPSWAGAATLGMGSYPGNPTKFWEGYFDSIALDIE